MQKNYRYPLLLAAVALFTFQSCSKSYFDELSSNPNLVTTPSLSALLATSTSKAGVMSYNVGSVISPYVQYTANPTAGSASDIYETIDFTGTWDALYYAMADVNELKKQAVIQNSSEYIGVADVLLAYNLTLVNDLWGDAPFSEAFTPSNINPKYDSQQDVYNSTMALIDEAITQLTKADATIKLAATSDLIYGTNTAANAERLKWLKAAYAFKARLLNKVSKTSGYNPTAVLAAIDNSFTTNADDAGMATFVIRNPWAQVAVNNAALSLSGWLSEQFIDQLNGKTYGLFDPRIKKITDVTVVPKNPNYPPYIGTVNGAGDRPNPPNNNTVKDENYISISSPWTSATAPLLIVTYAELKFIEAEAAFNIDKTRSYNAYLAGIGANMDKLQVPAEEKQVYLADPRVAVGPAALTKELIFKEKFVATYLNPEAFNDVRRNDYKYKDFTLPVGAVLDTYIRRLDYPLGERSKNGANVPAAVPRTTKLWWDQ
jgi:hypothetical protein